MQLGVIFPFTVYIYCWIIMYGRLTFVFKAPDKYLCLCLTMYSFLQVKHRRSDLLKHELVSTFLGKKFKFGALFHLANLLLYAFFLIFLTSYALTVPLPLDDICELRNNIIYWEIHFVLHKYTANITLIFAQVQQMLLTNPPIPQSPSVQVVTY